MHALKKILLVVGFSFLAFAAQGQGATDNIRLNQIGFYPGASKVAVIVGENAGGKFYLKTPDGAKTVFTGSLTESKPNEFSKKPTRIADFSGFSKTGTYVVEIPGVGKSYPFDIKPEVHKAAATAGLKVFYYQRMSVDLPEKYAGKWHRKAG